MATKHVGRHIRVPDLRNGYIEVLWEIANHGREVRSRGRDTLELLAPTIVIEDPIDTLPIGVGRGINLAIAAVEATQLVAGDGDYDLVVKVSRNFARFREPDGTFYGNYGVRIEEQFASACWKLKSDAGTRQAVIVLWDPDRDNLPGKRDYPCTVALQLVLRDDQLHLISIMRSNDAWLGLAYDAFQFAQLQLTAARVLDVAPGLLIHQPSSLHLYRDDLEQGCLEQLTETSDPRPTLLPRGFGNGPCTPEIAMTRAQSILFGYSLTRETTSESWFRSELDQARARARA